MFDFCLWVFVISLFEFWVGLLRYAYAVVFVGYLLGVYEFVMLLRFVLVFGVVLPFKLV